MVGITNAERKAREDAAEAQKQKHKQMWQALAAEAGMKVEAITATPAPMCQFITLTKT